MLKVIVFDFDGVIVDTKRTNYEICKLSAPNLTFEEYLNMHNGNVYENPTLQKISLSVDIDFEKFKGDKLKKLKPFELLDKTIEELNKKYKLCVITSGHEQTTNNFFKDNNIDKYFTKIYGKLTHKSKIEKFKMMFNEFKIKPEECLFITDTLGDLKEANEVNVKSLAVSWGFHEVEILNEGKPHKILHKFEELLPEILIFANEKIKVKYKNHKGEISDRTIIPKKIYYGSTNYHPNNGWLLEVFDIEKNDKRTYSFNDIIEWKL